MNRTVCVYFTKTELELLSSEIVAGTFEADSDNILVHQASIEPRLVRSDSFSHVLCFEYEKGSKFREKASILRNLEYLAEIIRQGGDSPAAIHLHLPRTSTSRSNYAIKYLEFAFPLAALDIRLIPHGLVSAAITPITLKYKIRFMRRKWHPIHLLFPSLRYYFPKGDVIGGLDPKVSTIYTFEGMRTPYPSEKSRELVGARDYLRIAAPEHNGSRTAVIIGQPLLKNGNMSHEMVETVSDHIHVWLQENNFDRVYYSRHPRSGAYLDFYREGYEILSQEGAVEVLLCQLQPTAVISCYSTALATARVLLGGSARALSFGLDQTLGTQKAHLATFLEDMGVELY